MSEVEGVRAFQMIPVEPPREWVEAIAKALASGRAPTNADRWDALMAYRTIAALAEEAMRDG
jgi:hypothetical protein